MNEFALTIFIFVFVALLAIIPVSFIALVIGGSKLLIRQGAAHRGMNGGNVVDGQVCSSPRCRTANPVHASFCRRCGQKLAFTPTSRPIGAGAASSGWMDHGLGGDA